ILLRFLILNFSVNSTAGSPSKYNSTTCFFNSYGYFLNFFICPRPQVNILAFFTKVRSFSVYFNGTIAPPHLAQERRSLARHPPPLAQQLLSLDDVQYFV